MDKLTESFSKGEHGAFEAVVSAYIDSVYRFMRSLTGVTEDAEDLTQDTFLEAERSAKRFRGECSLRTWLHTIAYRRYRRWRERNRRVAKLNPEMPSEVSVEHFRMDLDRALGDLSDEHRAVFLLAEVEQLDLAEIALALGLPVGTVKSRLSRAKAALRLALADNEEPIRRKVDELSNR